MSEPYDPNPASWAQQGFNVPPPAQQYPPQPYPAHYPPQQFPGQTYPPLGYPAHNYPVHDYQALYGAPSYSMYPDPNAASRGRPGQVIAASVLGYLESALLVLTAVILLSGSSVRSHGSGGIQMDGWGVEFAYAGLGDLLAAALLIAGGVLFTLGRRVGRTMLAGGLLLCVIEAIFYLVRLHDETGATTVGAVFYLVLPVVGTSLSFAASVSRWLDVVSPKRAAAAASN